MNYSIAVLGGDQSQDWDVTRVLSSLQPASKDSSIFEVPSGIGPTQFATFRF